MNPQDDLSGALDELRLDVEQLCRLVGVDARWVEQYVAEGLLVTSVRREGEAWRFDTLALRRVRRMVRLERDFDAVPELAALVADLEEEIGALRARLRLAGVPPESC